MERLERTSRTVVGGFSQSYWLLSSLLSQLKQDGYQPSEPALFDKTIQLLSSSMSLQASLVSGMTDFLVSKSRESFLSHVSALLSAPQKRELQVASGSGDFLFDQELLEKTSGQVKEDSLFPLMFLSRVWRGLASGVSVPRLTLLLLRLERRLLVRSQLSASAPGLRRTATRRSVSVVAVARLLLRLGRVFRSRSHVPVRFP